MAKSPTHSIRQTRDGSRTLVSEQYGQAFHSVHGAVTESRHVFIQGTNTATLLQEGKEPVHILEVGLGTGLNFLLTADLAQTYGTHITYSALEQQLIGSDILKELAYAQHLDNPALWSSYLSWLDTLDDVCDGCTLTTTFNECITLNICMGDATQTTLPVSFFHATYLDAFSPDVNPELWTPSFLSCVYESMIDGACLATYSARKHVRENLAEAGFFVSKRPGPPGKREMVIGHK